MPVGVVVEALLEVVVASLVAGVGVMALFSLVIYFATRASEMRQSDAPVLAFVLGAVAVVGLVACLAVVAIGIHVMTQK
jgi:hypothetical protein